MPCLPTLSICHITIGEAAHVIIGSPTDRIARVQRNALLGEDRHDIVLQVMG